MTRYIDADALKKHYAWWEDDRQKLFDSIVDQQPTVDAVPVRHGKWIHEVRYTIDSLHSYQQYRCSECGTTYITNTKYCPNCGARMDGK